MESPSYGMYHESKSIKKSIAVRLQIQCLMLALVWRIVWQIIKTRLWPFVRTAMSRWQMSTVSYSITVLVLLRICHAGATMFGEELHVQQSLPQVVGVWTTSL